MKVGFIADIHLQGGPESDEACALFRAAEVFHRERCELVCVNGDVFEGVSTPDQRLTFRAFLDELVAGCQTEVIVIRGNHDRREDLLVFHGHDINYPVQVRESAGHPITVKGLQVFVLPHYSSTARTAEEGTNDLTAILEDYRQQIAHLADPALVIFHGEVSGARLDSGYIPRENGIHLPLAALTSLGCPVVGGHYHKAQNVGGLVWYSGSITRQTFGEALDDKGILIWEIADGKWAPAPVFHSLSPRPHLLVEARWAAGRWVDQSGAPLEIPEAEPGSKIRFRYTVRESEAATVDLGPVREALGVGELHIDRQLVVESAVRDERITEAETVEDSLRVWMEQKALPSGEIDSALALLRELTDNEDTMKGAA